MQLFGQFRPGGNESSRVIQRGSPGSIFYSAFLKCPFIAPALDAGATPERPRSRRIAYRHRRTGTGTTPAPVARGPMSTSRATSPGPNSGMLAAIAPQTHLDREGPGWLDTLGDPA